MQMTNIKSVKILTNAYPNLHSSLEVENAIDRANSNGIENNPNNKETRVKTYIDRLEQVLDVPDVDSRKRRFDIYNNKYLFPSVLLDKNDIPESYLIHRKKILETKGFGDVDFSDSDRLEMACTIYNDQKQSLKGWTDYLVSSDVSYPTWFKYYTLKSIVKLGDYNRDTKKFKHRSKTTTGLFPELNREALSYTFDVLSYEFPSTEGPNDNELKSAIKSTNFSDIYAYAIEKMKSVKSESIQETDGKWVKYDEGSDSTSLFQSLQGRGTGWCTAGEATAKKQLRNGDFYVYYSKDSKGLYINPRIAVRLENGEVAEVRGVGFEQNLEENMIDIAHEKYTQLPGGEQFEKKDNDMRRLTELGYKIQNNLILSPEDYLFLYQVKSKIIGFGYGTDPRIEKLQEQRPLDLDLSNMNYIDKSFWFGRIQSVNNLIFPETVNTSLNFDSLTSSKGLTLPKIVNGDLSLDMLRSAKGLVLPVEINGELSLESLNTAEGFVFPESVNGKLRLRRLRHVDCLVLPEMVNGDLDLSNLESANDLILPETVGRCLRLDNLKSIDGVVMSKNVIGSLCLNSLVSVDGLILPELLTGGLNLNSIVSADGLKFPAKLNGDLNLNSIKTTDGLELSNSIIGDLSLNGLAKIDDFIFPEVVEGSIELEGVDSASNLTFFEKLGKTLNLRNLSSFENIIMPKKIGGSLRLDSLKSINGLVLPDLVKGDLELGSVISADGGIMPKAVFGDLNLKSLKTLDGLVLPEYGMHRGLRLPTEFDNYYIKSLPRFLFKSMKYFIKNKINRYDSD